MKNLKTFPLLIMTLLVPSFAQAQASLLKKEIDKIIRYERPLDYNVVPGVLIGILDGDSTFRFQYGQEIDMHGIYEMGSVTKPVVAWLANEALRSLHMDWFCSVCTFIPDSLCAGTWPYLTTDHIRKHTTGLPRLAPHIGEIETDVQDPYMNYTITALAEDLKSIKPGPGTYSYSHLGYAMLHWLFEQAGGLTAVTDRYLREPYGMNSTGWIFPDSLIEPGHGLDGRLQPAWNTNALRTALGLRSSLDDMLTFVRVLFDGYEKNRARHDPSMLKRELKSLSKTGAYKVVDGWFVISTGNSLVYYHNGRTGGHHVSIAFTPHLRKGVVIISNGAMGSNDLSLLILRMVNQSRKRKN